MHKLATDSIEFVKYYPMKEVLEIQFNGEQNITYQYFDVPEEVWYSFKNSPSVERFFNVKIATSYRMRCVKKQGKK